MDINVVNAVIAEKARVFVEHFLDESELNSYKDVEEFLTKSDAFNDLVKCVAYDLFSNEDPDTLI